MRWESSDPAAISLPQSPHVTLSLFLSLGVGPSPVMMCPYVSSDLSPVCCTVCTSCLPFCYSCREGGKLLREGFKEERGVTQGDPLSPTIFNVVVDAVVRHWLMIAV